MQHEDLGILLNLKHTLKFLAGTLVSELRQNTGHVNQSKAYFFSHIQNDTDSVISFVLW